MAALPPINADPPAHKGPPSKSSELHFDDCTNDDQICLSELHQMYIDEIAKHLDLKSLVRLQLTCKTLFQKGLIAQRQITCPLAIMYSRDGVFDFRSRDEDEVHWTAEEVRAMNFRFQAYIYINGDLTLDVINRVTELVEDRGTIEMFSINDVNPLPPEVGPMMFNEFLQTFNIPHLISARTMPDEYFTQPAVKHLKHLIIIEDFHFSLLYFLDTAIESCLLFLDPHRVNRQDSEEFHEILESWTRKEKAIKSYSFDNFNWDEGDMFHDWKIINEGEEIPPVRPIVIRANMEEEGFEAFRVIRSDDACLWLKYVFDFSMTVKDNPQDDD